MKQVNIVNAAKAAARPIRITFPFLQVLTLIFVVAKITGNLDWSWILVFSPVWLPFAVWIGGVLALIAIFLAVFGIVFLGAFLIDTFNSIKNKRRIKKLNEKRVLRK